MEQFKVKVNKQIFMSEITGFGVFRVTGLKPRSTNIIVGELFDVHEGDTLEIEGEFTAHPKFGSQFRVTAYQSVFPDDRDGMVKYLASRHIRGLGEKSAEKIVNAFGAETFRILENQPERLKEIKGLSRKLVETVRETFLDNLILRELSVKLTPAGIGQSTVFRIFQVFKEKTPDILKSNPYITISRVHGVGFRTADTIARTFGLAEDDPLRICAALDFVLEQAETQFGDLYLPVEELTYRCCQLLSLPAESVEQAVADKIERNELMRESIPEEIVLSQKNFSLEKSIADMLKKISGVSVNADPVADTDLDRICRQLSLELTDEQKQAAMHASQYPLTIITGGPGTGKTTIIRIIIEIFVSLDLSVRIAAPTGRAAKRIEEATGFPASTIHRLLKVNPETRSFTFNESNPLKTDAVIVDEFSMVDVHIFYSLLKALAGNTRLIIIGDRDQLPSVGPGNILRDMIESGLFATIYLSRNFRQTANSLIVENAYRINSGEPLLLKPYADDLDFVFIRVQSPQQAQSKIRGILRHLADRYPFNSGETQILIPMYRGPAGIDSINALIQEEFNPERIFLRKEKFQIKKLDKVMQLKNNYEKEIFNGEQGIIADFNEDSRKITVDFDSYFVEYDPAETDELTLSYSVSIHKSQGSEYDNVILVLLPQHAIMLNREIFYTAVTRARKKIFLISDLTTITRAIEKSTPGRRRTLLLHRLQQAFSAL